MFYRAKCVGAVCCRSYIFFYRLILILLRNILLLLCDVLLLISEVM
jgi:hypothetical protein